MKTHALEDITHADRLAAEITASVLSGEFRPGLRLDEQMLADRYAVSRTPVREALRRLASTGLIEIKPRRGATVTRATSAQIEVLFGAMAEIEATCARLSALSMTPLERRRLASFHESMQEFVEQEDGEGFAAANLTFHTQIYVGAHNPIIADFASGLRRRLAPFRRAQFRTRGRLPRSHEEHRRVVEAISGGNPAEAHAAMFQHMSLVEESFERLAESI
ncbi:MAG TPA: GntR family transcriptional regulator [Xanthobacteraceae bacterium]|nr:GntR family transcriptional regulator [Xanthobacteraceae bacterium]